VTAEEWGRGDVRRLSTRDFPAEVVALVEAKQGGRFCVLCREQGLTPPADEQLVLDHLQPLSKGGDNHWSNLRWLCASHNAARQDRAGWSGPPAWVHRVGVSPPW
jgi:5-methylcytosine-specific restriction endonuclease McrA